VAKRKASATSSGAQLATPTPTTWTRTWESSTPASLLAAKPTRSARDSTTVGMRAPTATTT
jgi:hypothetical protein